MDDFLRRVREESEANAEFMPEIEKALEQQQENLEAQQTAVKKEAAKKEQRQTKSINLNSRV